MISRLTKIFHSHQFLKILSPVNSSRVLSVGKRFLQEAADQPKKTEEQPSIDEAVDKSIQKLQNILDNKNKEIDELKTEVQIFKNLRLESVMEVSRIRARADKDIEDAKLFGCSSFAKNLLEVADVLDKAIDLIPAKTIDDATKETNNIYAAEFVKLHQGICMTRNLLVGAFKRNGLTKIHPLGEPFDTKFHAAKYEIPPTVGGYPPKTVGEVFRSGYAINGRVIRPAEVGVIKYE